MPLSKAGSNSVSLLSTTVVLEQFGDWLYLLAREVRAFRECVRKCAVPKGTASIFPTLPSTPPAAPCWAKLSRAYGAGFSPIRSHWQIPSLVHTHALKARVKGQEEKSLQPLRRMQVMK